MTKQIIDLIEDISFNFNEDDSVIIKTYIESLESRIAKLEAHKTCESCKYWCGKSCMNMDGIAYGGTNAVYEDDYCKDHEEKLTYENCTNKNDF